MEVHGSIKSWNDEKGFGFIRPEQGGPEVFAHISAMRGDRRPLVGDKVLYIASRDDKGRIRAEHLRLAGELSLDQPSIRRKPRKPQPEIKKASRPPRRQGSAPMQNLGFKTLVFACLYALPLFGSFQLFFKAGFIWILVAYGLMSLVSFVQYWSDKAKAMRGAWRIPETTLHLVELSGGWPGALIAQQCFRHKTRKGAYQLIFWLIILAHQLFWFDWLVLGGEYFGHFIRRL
ncbi:DUF1294 domain-containing protein [Pseudomonas sp. S9]|uniref:DUF1294 domain-containing protein n=1 Tax=Pseudomonas sp. S9 TaxID=686578 RepID=UPI0002556FC5|nr:DUF1294 domain-containing protein [Pseudomonas sp. S9]